MIPTVRSIAFAGISAGLLAASGSAAIAHPHVFVEANLEIVRSEDGTVRELRHVWRFDELFSSTVLLDFDTNADGKLDADELDEVSSVVTESIGESNFFTELRKGGQTLSFVPPEKILVDYDDSQILMFFAVQLKDGQKVGANEIRISVSDPSYYVAIEIADEAAIQISGNGAACQTDIRRPDFDTLYANNNAKTEQFFADPQNASLGDEWMTWITLNCK